MPNYKPKKRSHLDTHRAAMAAMRTLQNGEATMKEAANAHDVSLGALRIRMAQYGVKPNYLQSGGKIKRK